MEIHNAPNLNLKKQKNYEKKKLIITNKQETSLKNEPKNKNKKNNNNFKYYNTRKMPTLNISKILKCSTGKEFKIKITPRIKKRCLSVLSCGPKHISII